MKNRIIGAILLLSLSLVVVMSVYYLMPLVLDRRQKDTSDAGKVKGQIRVAMDNWIGYFPLCSPEMKSALKQSGYLLVCEDDKADYGTRMKRIKSGEIDFAVATIDSYLLNGASLSYPATIIMVIDESKGGDAILARTDAVQSLNDFSEKGSIRVAFTPASPSHFLLKAAADHFNVPGLLPPKGAGRLETDGSEQALEKLLTGAADVAVLWEPDVSKALEQAGIKKILGTEDTEKLIVDILLVNRDFSRKSPEVVKQLLDDYFRVLKKYRDQPDLFIKHIKKETGLSEDKVKLMLNGVHWASFTENTEKWFGISLPGIQVEDGIMDAIEATAGILVSGGDFSTSPIPDNNPYRLTNSSFLEALFTKGLSGFTVPGAASPAKMVTGSLEADFPLLDENGWATLKEIGTLRMDPIIFQTGSNSLSITAKQVVDQGVERLKHYPNFRVIIRGHTGTRGDREENLKLSRQRAEAVARYMTITYSIDPDRLKIEGKGGEMALVKKPGENERAYQYRLPRVELSLMREDI